MSDARNDAIVAYDNPMRDDNLAIGYRALKVNGFGDGWDSRSAEVAALHVALEGGQRYARRLEAALDAAAHTTDLREQSKHYTGSPRPDSEGE